MVNCYEIGARNLAEVFKESAETDALRSAVSLGTFTLVTGNSSDMMKDL